MSPVFYSPHLNYDSRNEVSPNLTESSVEEFPPGMTDMIPFTKDEKETFCSICVVPGPAVTVASFAAFDTFFVDGAHMKNAQFETKWDNAQLLTVEQKSSIVKERETKNLPLAMCVCLSESIDEYGFTFWTLETTGFSLNKKSVNILHDRGKAVIAARAAILPKGRQLLL